MGAPSGCCSPSVQKHISGKPCSFPTALAQLLHKNPVLTGASASSQLGLGDEWWPLQVMEMETLLYARAFVGAYQSHGPRPHDDLVYIGTARLREVLNSSTE